MTKRITCPCCKVNGSVYAGAFQTNLSKDPAELVYKCTYCGHGFKPASMRERSNLFLAVGVAGYHATMDEIGRLNDFGVKITPADRKQLTTLRKAVSAYLGINLEDKDPID